MDWPLREVAIDGARLRYAEVGAGDPLVLLHGYPQSHACWRHQIPALAEHRRVIAPDWLGWGASERSLALACDYDAEVARLGRLFDALGLDAFDLATHDYGGFLGLGYVIRHAARVRRFAILNSRAHRTFPSPAYQQFALMSLCGGNAVLRAAFARLPLGAIHRRSLARYVRKGCFDAARLDRYVGWMDEPEGRRWLAHFFAGYRVAVRPELAEGLAGIRAPTAVIWGDRDPFCPLRNATELAAGIPGATLHRLGGADHYVMEERPAEVTAALLAWLARS